MVLSFYERLDGSMYSRTIYLVEKQKSGVLYEITLALPSNDFSLDRFIGSVEKFGRFGDSHKSLEMYIYHSRYACRKTLFYSQ